ncbi:ATP-binding protein [Paenalkalicoccus suaedae]|uniref:ATP-binding protein n=1 Tax=Paenalkalicoccus suaedae TaxID=2592382 RepID=A0A859FH52_9BACI|nr:DEAD/DEAH box helicase [Paenalkalicoccus suaedae]QKS72693.1 ATP-binding protein [Paenalkalicoccus suaedae]
MSELNVNILKAWHFIESLHTPIVPKKKGTWSKEIFTDNTSRNKLRRLYENEQTWQPAELHESKKEISYRYYRHIFKEFRLIELIKTKLGDEEKLINRGIEELFSLTFSVDQKGQYIADSLFVPFSLFFITKINQADVVYDSLANEFKEALNNFEEGLKELLLDGVTNETMNKIDVLFARYFFVMPQLEKCNYLEYVIIRKNQQQPIDYFNSFYLDDLEQAMTKVNQEPLQSYLTGNSSNNRIDIDENRSFIEEITRPALIPNGRWPSPVAHKLSLMQQVAVNTVLDKKLPISSVNGPPGTGKTTLLKDIFADLYVQRAEAMISFSHPLNMFTKVGETRGLGPNKRSMYSLHQNVAAFNMVVASSNNGAVENISLELPMLTQIGGWKKDEDKLHEFEKRYIEEVKQINMFTATAESLLDSKKAWGVFAAKLGRSKNIDDFANAIGDKQNPSSLKALLDSENASVEDWNDAVKEFNVVRNQIHVHKTKLEQFNETHHNNADLSMSIEQLEKDQQGLVEEKKTVVEELRTFERKLLELNEQIKQAPAQTWWKRALKLKNKALDDLLIKKQIFVQQVTDSGKELHSLEGKEAHLQILLNVQRQKFKSYESELAKLSREKVAFPNDAFWEETPSAYDTRQKESPWISDELNYLRGLLFIKAVKVHKIAILLSKGPIFSAIDTIRNRKNLNVNIPENRAFLANMWDILHLVTPVISSTFASIQRMYKGIEGKPIDYLFIDEAGQASPQQAVGAVMRAGRVIAVGDPVQIEPVVTMDEVQIEDIRAHFEIDERYVGSKASVQTLADEANPYGMYKKAADLWIGMPLWVHRRCLDPMFSIANKMAYENKMVLTNSEAGVTSWINCVGKAKNAQFVEEQANYVAQKIVEAFTEAGAPVCKEDKFPNIYVISPFTAVKFETIKIVKARLKELFKDSEENMKKSIEFWIAKSVGTVHTFQGKEADIVYFITGTDENTDGAANWSCSSVNILNVAVTRAKKEFHLVGDYERFENKEFYRVIAEHAEVVESKRESLTSEDNLLKV